MNCSKIIQENSKAKTQKSKFRSGDGQTDGLMKNNTGHWRFTDKWSKLLDRWKHFSPLTERSEDINSRSASQMTKNAQCRGTFKGNLQPKIISFWSDSLFFFCRWVRWWRSEVEIQRGRRSNWQRKKLAQTSVLTSVEPPRLHSRSR